MILGDAVIQALPRLRAQAESMMTATVVVKRPGPVTENPDGTVTPSWTLVDSGKGRISGDRPYESNPEAGGHVETVQRYILSKPIGTGPYEVGDVAKVTAEPNNPALVGRYYRIAGPDVRSQQTATRMFIEDFNEPAGVVGFDD